MRLDWGLGYHHPCSLAQVRPCPEGGVRGASPGAGGEAHWVGVQSCLGQVGYGLTVSALMLFLGPLQILQLKPLSVEQFFGLEGTSETL